MAEVSITFLPQSMGSAALGLDIQVDEDSIQALVDRLSDPTPVLNRVARILRRAAAERFRQAGPGWKELSPATVASKIALNQPVPGKDGRTEARRFRQAGASSAAMTILIRSGALRDSWVRKNDPHHVENIDPDQGTVSIGSDLDYAEAHQKGTPPTTIVPAAALALRFVGANGRQVFARVVHHPGLPPRPVEIKDRDIEAIEREIERWLAGAEDEGGD